MENVEKLFADSKLDNDVDLKACVACLSFIITSAVRYNCDNSALFSELQQLGLPREHSVSLIKVTTDKTAEITKKLEKISLKIHNLDDVKIDLEPECHLAMMNMTIDGKETSVALTPLTVDVLLENLKAVLSKMKELDNYGKRTV
ncbi:COMM domain-containing protein 4 [Agrilus planipennis]|uniref:COMM domain-containing protein 4 n=1 Tax=Agrilus planipennis TaxID=224129 RepID=A0A7F5RHX7_AGRPL|nr:COMM domain-containing protein 4 [Agrilus planipennis]